jgi:hypothetical protein
MMGKMIFIPGMKPGMVSGAAGSSRRSQKETLTFGGQYRGKATPKNLVPYEEPRNDSETKARKAKEQRARDVAQAYDMAKYQPNTTRERLAAVRAEAETAGV